MTQSICVKWCVNPSVRPSVTLPHMGVQQAHQIANISLAFLIPPDATRERPSKNGTSNAQQASVQTSGHNRSQAHSAV